MTQEEIAQTIRSGFKPLATKARYSNPSMTMLRDAASMLWEDAGVVAEVIGDAICTRWTKIWCEDGEIVHESTAPGLIRSMSLEVVLAAESDFVTDCVSF